MRPQNQTVSEGQNVTMHCNASGNPPPNIFWHNLRKSDDTVATGVALVITTAKRSDADFYSCIATNGIGIPSMAEAFINVQCKFG